MMKVPRLRYRNPEIASRLILNQLHGPFEYSKEIIDKEIPKNVKGNYILCNIESEDECDVRYVGRSDNDLRTRIGHEIGKYSHFFYSIAESEKEAYHQECLMWHLYDGEEGELDNSIHPDRPDGDRTDDCWLCRIKEMM